MKVSWSLMSLAILFVLAGCGGKGDATLGSSNSSSLGSFTTRAAGTAQPPVISISPGATVYGLAGASFTEVVQSSVVGGYASPAVGKVAFIRNNELCVMDADGKNVRTLTSTYSWESGPTFSPDGTRIAFEYEDGISFVRPDGTGYSRFLEDAEAPSWSKDGSQLVFTRRTGGYGTDQVFRVRADGTELTQLTTTGGLRPFWAPDATRIYFSRGDSLWWIRPTGGTATKVVDGEFATVSPDGKKLAYTWDFNNRLSLVNVDGTGSIQVAVANFAACSPSFSRDGKSIFFSAGTPTSRLDVFSMTVGGGNVTNLTPGSSLDDWYPTTSPLSTTVPPPTSTTKRLIGTGGSFGASCAGFLFGQKDRAVTSVVTFDTKTTTVAGRSLARVAPLSSAETNGQNLVFHLSASDGSPLAGFKYTNGDSPVYTLLPGLTTQATGIIVTFSGSDGGVATVLPYTGTRAQAPYSVTREGQILKVSAEFIGLWDNKGMQQKGGSFGSVSIDLKTGQVVKTE